MSPRTLFRGAAVAEAVTWALLLTGMLLKYVTDTTEVGVQVAGPIHGVAFVAYCVTAVVVAVDQRWTPGRLLLALVSAVPPFATVVLEPWVERRGGLADAWRLRHEPSARALDRPVSWLVRNPVAGLASGLAAVAVLTGVALLAGPPA